MTPAVRSCERISSVVGYDSFVTYIPLGLIFEPPAGIEPTSTDYKTVALPLCYKGEWPG